MSETFPAIDLQDVAAGIGGFVITSEKAGDLVGTSVASAGDINGDGFADVVIGAVGVDGPGSNRSSAGAAYVLFGKANGFATEIDVAQLAQGDGGFVIQGGDAEVRVGRSVASAGDLNNDGLADLVVSAYQTDGAERREDSIGATYVIFGKTSGFGAAIDIAQIAQGQGGFVLRGVDAFDFSGISVATAGDVNGDGFDDLIIGASNADAAGDSNDDAGAAYVVFGKASGFGAVIDLAEVAQGQGGFVIRGEDADDGAGRSVASAGDLNGDGFDDLIVGARDADGSGNRKDRAGAAYVVFGKASDFGAAIDLAEVVQGQGGFVIQGETRNQTVGLSVASAGDVNGDGFKDLIVGSVGANAAGEAFAGASYVVFGKAGGFGAAIDLGQIAHGDGGFVIQGEDASDIAGYSVASAGDFNGDGFDDLIVGARNASVGGDIQNGAAYVVFGKATGLGSPIDLALVAQGQGGFVIEGEESYDDAGTSVASAGDLNGDGFDDLLVGAAAADGINNNKSYAGAAYVIFGRAFGPAEPTNGNDTLSGGAGADTIEGLGGGDRLSGNDGNDVLRGGNGRDTLLGGEGNDTLAGGKGRDVLDGGAGADLFRFAVPSDGPDTILGFTAADEIQFATAGFGNLPLGAVKANRFEADADGTASSAAVRFVYETTTGKLSFDADGSGAGASVLVAVLDGAPSLAAADIVII